jgi:NAD(P)-dependent dehydrogenase (short-subunit alcohol dehydrogenase family)
MNPFDLSGKVALVTGSTRGIGKAIVTRMAEAGARVVVSSRKEEAVASVAAALQKAGHEVLGLSCNIGKKDELRGLVDATMARWGRIDVLVCNAAANPYYGPVLDISDEAWDKIMVANLKGALWLSQMVIPQMAARKDGAVIFVSSIGAVQGETALGAYAVSKAGEAQLARNLAVEWGVHNIRVNTIAPGLVKTDFARALWENPKLLADVEARTPLRRIGDPDDIAGIAVALAAPAGRFVTGQFIVVDGGLTITGVTPAAAG